jgi:hypothetical protein
LILSKRVVIYIEQKSIMNRSFKGCRTDKFPIVSCQVSRHRRRST